MSPRPSPLPVFPSFAVSLLGASHRGEQNTCPLTLHLVTCLALANRVSQMRQSATSKARPPHALLSSCQHHEKNMPGLAHWSQ